MLSWKVRLEGVCVGVGEDVREWVRQRERCEELDIGFGWIMSSLEIHPLEYFFLS